jgi:hypothetical protein
MWLKELAQVSYLAAVEDLVVSSMEAVKVLPLGL